MFVSSEFKCLCVCGTPTDDGATVFISIFIFPCSFRISTQFEYYIFVSFHWLAAVAHAAQTISGRTGSTPAPRQNVKLLWIIQILLFKMEIIIACVILISSLFLISHFPFSSQLNLYGPQRTDRFHKIISFLWDVFVSRLVAYYIRI